MNMRIIALCSVLMLGACNSAFVEKLPPEPPKYVYNEPEDVKPSANSLWGGGSNLFTDTRARGINDLVTIRVVESAAAKKKAGTTTDRDSSVDLTVDELFGLPLDFNKSNMFGQGHTFDPTVKASTANSFEGSGETSREGTLTATITAKVVEVLPNGNFIVESRKEITVNREKQIIVLRGQIRPEDIDMNNTVLSSCVADAKIYYTGSGVINDKQGQGWMVRVLDNVWPF